MFTGIIQEVGTIKNIADSEENQKISIEANLASNLNIGASISVDGACLTVVSKQNNTFEAVIMPETIKRTVASKYQSGTKVNLEPAIKVNDRLDGHIVTGHIDFTSKVISAEKDKDGYNITINFPTEYRKYIAMKGSITVNGASLTISKLLSDAFEISLIPHTLEITNLGQLKAGSSVNIEVDLIARYLENLLKEKDQQVTYEFLQQRGFI